MRNLNDVTCCRKSVLKAIYAAVSRVAAAMMVLAGVLAVVFSFCLAEVSGAQDETGLTAESAVGISQPNSRVLVRIENPDELQLELWSTDRIPKMLHSQSQELFFYRVDSGKYKLFDSQHKTTYPIPAIAAALKEKTPKEKTPKEKAPKEKVLTVKVMTPPSQDSESSFSWIPAGPTLLGDEIGVGHKDEQLAVKHVAAFWIGQTEVTNQQYVNFLNSVNRCDETWLDLGSRKCRIKPVAESKTQFMTDKPKEPVVMVSLAGARAYCQHVSEKTGLSHRLPTETEWERAARGPGSTVFSYGNAYYSHLANQESGSISDVGSFYPSEWMLYDMTGNVFEWMDNPYSPKEPDRVMNQALRGGSFVLDGMYLRNSFRMRQSPTVMTDDIGFRVIREFKQQGKKDE